MVKLDVQVLKYLTSDCWRILQAIEMGQRNHELVPTDLIFKLGGLKRGGSVAALSTIHKFKLVAHDSKIYDGYRLTYRGYDYLALHTLVKHGNVAGVGTQVGVGKESDIFVCEQDAEEGKKAKRVILKLTRLGRVSFRDIKQSRDYLQKRRTCSWLYLSRLSAQIEFKYMQCLHKAGYPVPRPIDANRHAIIMSLVPGQNLSQIRELKDPGALYERLMDLVVEFASDGLIHCDYNEFNIMVTAEGEMPVIIDFPQMVSTNHENAQELFERDVDCIETFFARRFDYIANKAKPRWEDVVASGRQLDLEVGASGADMSLVEKPTVAKEERKQMEGESLAQRIRSDVRKARNKERDQKRNARTKRQGKRVISRAVNRELKREVKETL